jgi:hypothetical protein
MSEISKQALKVDNSTSFPNNTTGYISPTILRAFNVNMIDSLVDEIGYTADSASWNVSIGQLNAFTASQQPSFNALNSFTASQLVINTGVNSFTQSATGRLNNLESTTASLNTFSSSINQIIVNGVSIGTSTRFFFNGFVSASIVPNVDGAIASITILADQTFASSASFNAYTASTNAWTASAKVEIAQLLQFSSSLDATYATDAQLNFSASVLQNNIDVNNAKFNDYTSSNDIKFNAYTASTDASIASINTFTASIFNTNTFTASTNIRLNNLETTSASVNVSITNLNSTTASLTTRINGLASFTGSYATTGSNTFVQPQIISSSLTLTGSAYGNVFSASIVSSTASIDLNVANFFRLSLPNGVITNINVLNPKPGTTAIIEITNTGIPSASFSSNVKQQQFNSYLPSSGSGTTDLLSVISLTTSSVYVANSLNFV